MTHGRMGGVAGLDGLAAGLHPSWRPLDPAFDDMFMTTPFSYATGMGGAAANGANALAAEDQHARMTSRLLVSLVER